MGLIHSNENKNINKKFYGFIQDTNSKEDWIKKYAISDYIKNGSVKVVDLRSKCPKVYEQGDKNRACTANAVCSLYSYMYMEKNKLTKDDDVYFSRLYVYWNARSNKVKDNGSTIKDTIKSLCRYGVPLEKYCEYDLTKINVNPADNSIIMAQKYIDIKYYRLEKDINQLKQSLIHGAPFVFGFAVYESFISEELAKTGMMSVPTEDEKILGGHCVMAVGFDDDKKCFIIQNSWGNKWGIDGYFYMPYDYWSISVN